MDFFSFLLYFILASMISIKFIGSTGGCIKKTQSTILLIFLSINLCFYCINTNSILKLSLEQEILFELKSIGLLLYSEYHLKITCSLILFQLGFFLFFGMRNAIIPEKYLVFIHVFYLTLSLSKLKWFGIMLVLLTFIASQCHVYFRFYNNFIRAQAGVFGLFVASLNYYLESFTFDEFKGQLFYYILLPAIYIFIFCFFNVLCLEIIISLKNEFVSINDLKKFTNKSIALHMFLYSKHKNNNTYFKITGLFVLNTFLLVASEYYLEGFYSTITYLSFLGYSYLFGLLGIIDYNPGLFPNFLFNFSSVFTSLIFYYKIYSLY